MNGEKIDVSSFLVVYTHRSLGLPDYQWQFTTQNSHHTHIQKRDVILGQLFRVTKPRLVSHEFRLSNTTSESYFKSYMVYLTALVA